MRTGLSQCEIQRVYLRSIYTCIAFCLFMPLFLVSEQVEFDEHLLIWNNIMCVDRCYVVGNYV